MGTVGQSKEWQDLGDLFIVKNISSRELDRRANLHDQYSSDHDKSIKSPTRWLKSTTAIPSTSGPL